LGSKREEVTGELRKIHNEELNVLNCSPNIFQVIKSRRIKLVGHVGRMGEGRGVYRVLMRKPDGKRTIGRPRCRWENSIKMDIKEVGSGGMA
jgi:hypothetical protein